jgi:hypothetical protein
MSIKKVVIENIGVDKLRTDVFNTVTDNPILI